MNSIHLPTIPTPVAKQNGFSHDVSQPQMSAISTFHKSINSIKDFLSSENKEAVVLLLQQNVKDLNTQFKNCTNKAEFGDWLLECEFANISTQILNYLQTIGIFSNNETWFSTYYLYTLSMDVTNEHIEYCLSLADCGLPNLLDSNIRNSNYINNMKSDVNIKCLITVSLRIVYNMVKIKANIGYFKGDHEDDAFKQSVLKLMKIAHDKCSSVAALILVRIIDECESNLLDEVANIIPFFVNCLDKVLHNKNKDVPSSFTVSQLVEGLAALSINDPIKMALIEKGVISLLLEICENSKSDHDIYYSCKIIWNMSFDSKLRNILDQKYSVLPTLNKLSKMENEKIRIAADGAIWLLTKKDNDELSSKESQPKTSGNNAGNLADKYVFISYCHTDKIIVYKIRDKLLENNISAWIDRDNMKKGNSVLQTMANGIEGSSGVILCMSEYYRKSEMCRMEIEYAFQKNKPIVPILVQARYKPDGYLGIVIGLSYYFDFGGKYQFEDKINELIYHITYSLYLKNVGNNLDIERRSADGYLANDTTDATIKINKIQLRNLKLWSHNQLQTWLCDQSFQSLSEKLKDLDGKLFVKMFDLKNEAPDVFYKGLQESFKFSFVETLQLLDVFDNIVTL